MEESIKSALKLFKREKKYENAEVVEIPSFAALVRESKQGNTSTPFTHVTLNVEGRPNKNAILGGAAEHWNKSLLRAMTRNGLPKAARISELARSLHHRGAFLTFLNRGLGPHLLADFTSNTQGEPKADFSTNEVYIRLLNHFFDTEMPPNTNKLAMSAFEDGLDTSASQLLDAAKAADEEERKTGAPAPGSVEAHALAKIAASVVEKAHHKGFKVSEELKNKLPAAQMERMGIKKREEAHKAPL
jgi:hypothetical protein